jgi:hypothetical protein
VSDLCCAVSNRDRALVLFRSFNDRLSCREDGSAFRSAWNGDLPEDITLRLVMLELEECIEENDSWKSSFGTTSSSVYSI